MLAGAQHPSPEEVNDIIAQQVDQVDPASAVEKLVIDNRVLQNQVARMQSQMAVLTKEKAEAQATAQKYEPYKDIINTSKTFLAVYLRDPVVYKTLLCKAKDLYGKQADIDRGTKTEKQEANLKIDHMVETIIQWSFIHWHKIVPRILGT